MERYLLPRINGAINFLIGFLGLLQDSVRAYQTPKVLPARIGASGEILDVELIIEPGKGVVGFQS